MPKIIERPLAQDIAGRRLISAKETEQLLGVSKRKLYEFTFRSSGNDRLPSYKLGKSRMYRLDQVQYFIDNHQEPV